jgi:diaminopimelate epimerase
MKLDFTKYHGAGNDFILIDDRELSFPVHDFQMIARLCHRRFGIGGDGLILLQPSKKGDVLFRIFNADGKEAAMCGNGIRCLVHFAKSLGLNKDICSVETQRSILSCRVIDGKVTSSFESFKQFDFPIRMGDREVYCINTGVPHAVVFVDHLDIPDFYHQAREIRFHSFFQPEGVNVNFVMIQNDQSLHCRTYERGVEGETLACGTGAVAAAAVAKHLYQMTSPIKVIPASQEVLEVDINSDGIQMTGPVHLVFKGSYCWTAP